MPAGFGALHDQGIGPGIQRGQRLIDVMHLNDGQRAAVLDRGNKGPGIAKRQGDHVGPIGQGQVQQFEALGHGEHHQADAPRFLDVAHQRQLGFHPVRIAIAGPDQTKPAGPETAAASRPPAAPPMGASTTGWVMFNSRVSAESKLLTVYLLDVPIKVAERRARDTQHGRARLPLRRAPRPPRQWRPGCSR